MLDDVFCTIEEAALLEGISYTSLYKRIQRNSKEYITKKVPSTDGGKERVLVSISSLSKKARKIYKEKITADKEAKEVLIGRRITDEENPWYIEADYHWYVENYKEEYYKAVELAKQLEKFVEYSGSDKTGFAKEYAMSLGMSSRTLFRKTKAMLNGLAWAVKMNEKDGNDYSFYRVLALCTKPKKIKKYISLTEMEKVYIQNIWFDEKFARNHGSKAMAYEVYLKKAKMEGWEPVSYSTINRYIEDLMVGRATAHYLVAQGMRETKNKRMLKARRNTGALKVMEIIQGDSHTFDCWVKIKRSNGKESIIRPILSAFIDTRSRCLVGWGICEVPNSQVLKNILLNMIYEKEDPEVPFYGVPEYILIDNGKDYTAESLTGRPRNVRVDFDAETKGFYRSIGIKDDIRSLPYQAWGKAQIERFFLTVCNKFTRWLDSYVGTLTGSKTAGKIKKDVKKLNEEGKLMTIEEFSEAFGYWLKTVYHKSVHSGLKEQKEPVPIPIEVYKNAERYMKAPPPKSYAEMLLMKSSGALIRTTGIRKFGFDYQSPEFGERINEHVTIRWNPSDITRLYVYSNDGKKICEAISHELLAFGPKITEKALEDHIKMQKKQLKKSKEIIDEMQMSFEDRMANKMNELAEEQPLLTEKLKTEKGTGKVVSLPIDRQYRDSLKENKKVSEKDKKEKEPIRNEFFEKMANKAFEALEALENM